MSGYPRSKKKLHVYFTLIYMDVRQVHYMLGGSGRAGQEAVMTNELPPPLRPSSSPALGVGKTTAIRELGRLLADQSSRRVVIVDTSNEIGGDGDVPHAGVGGCRRMQVPHPAAQHHVMIEAVENHMPQVRTLAGWLAGWSVWGLVD